MAEYDYTGRSVSWVRVTIIAGLLILLGVLIWVVFFRSSSPSNGGNGNIAQQPNKGSHTSQEQSNQKSSGKNSHASSGTSKPKSSGGNSGSQNSSGTSSSSASSTKKSKSTSPSSTPKSSSSSVASSPSTSTQTNSHASQLVNTGPGDVIAIFAATTAAGTAFYRLRLRRRNHGNL